MIRLLPTSDPLILANKESGPPLFDGCLLGVDDVASAKPSIVTLSMLKCRQCEDQGYFIMRQVGGKSPVIIRFLHLGLVGSMQDLLESSKRI